MAKLFSQRKGQSAIEYLTTYGWMLLVIAIVGGAIFTTVQNSSQIQSTSGLANADVQIENFGVAGDSLQVELRAASSDQVENVKVNLSQQNAPSGASQEVTTSIDSSNNVTIPVGQTATMEFDEIENSENTNTFDVEITYDTGGLEGLTADGTLTGRMAHNSTTS